MLPTFARATHNAAPRFDAFDDSLIFPFGPKPYNVARSHDVPLVGCESFEQAARGALKHAARFVADDVYQTLHTENAAQSADRAINVGQDERACVVFDNFAAGERS